VRGRDWAWGWNWARASSTAFSLLRHSLNVLKITVANPPPEATPRLPEPRTKPVYEQASINQAPAARLNSSSATPAMIVAPRRAPGFSGSSRRPSGGGGAHFFMTFGLCTRNEKRAAAPLKIRTMATPKSWADLLSRVCRTVGKAQCHQVAGACTLS
jgi:hypothetical protein